MAEPSPADVLKPLGSTLVELLQMPLNIMKDSAPDLQRQVQQLPETVRLNAQFFMKTLREGPASLQASLTNGAKEANAPLMAARTISPVPLLSPDQIVEELKKSAKAPEKK